MVFVVMELTRPKYSGMCTDGGKSRSVLGVKGCFFGSSRGSGSGSGIGMVYTVH